MAKENEKPAQPAKAFEIQRIYLQDVSFESPQAPVIFTKEIKPSHNVEINANNKKIADNVYEVIVIITLTVKAEDEVAYLIEIKHGGIFTIVGYEDQEVAQILGSQCPGIIYPFAREAICDLAVKGGFPQIHLAPINFDSLYAHHVREQAQANIEKDDAIKH